MRTWATTESSHSARETAQFYATTGAASIVGLGDSVVSGCKMRLPSRGGAERSINSILVGSLLLAWRNARHCCQWT